jgi:nucleotidyltransferase/DNA polymerase involved in DNA repair
MINLLASRFLPSQERRRRYIMHLDGDSFFVSVEAAKNPRLRGKPVVTGAERGIASAMSIEAKKLGITRGMPVFQIRKLFPQVIVTSSDYESYAVYSRRMMDIVRRYTDTVEEYSIDECFADFSQDRNFTRNPRPILEKIKGDIKRELGITVSLGLGPTKVIAKTASKRNKPDGLTILSPDEVPLALATTPVSAVWGIGGTTSIALRKRGVSTALELARKPIEWVREHFSKPMVEMWYELNSVSVLPVRTEYEAQKSIMKTRTFGPASNDRAVVFSELSKNIENAARKARELGLCAREFSIFLKTKEFTYSRTWCRLALSTNSTFDILPEAEKLFDSIFSKKYLYRATGVTLYALSPADLRQEDLFGSVRCDDETSKVFRVVDRVNKKYGRNVLCLASSVRAFAREGQGERAESFMPKGFWKKLSIPFLGDVR